MRRNDPEKLGKILDTLKEKSALGRHLEQGRIWDRWNDLAGPHLAAHGEPKTIRDNTLFVEVDSPVWMHRFAYKKWEIIKRINRMSGHELISDIFVVLRSEDEPVADRQKAP